MDSLESKFKNKEAEALSLKDTLSKPINKGLPDVPEVIPSTQKLDQFTTQVRQGLDNESQQWIKAQTDSLKQLNKEAQDLYKSNKDAVQNAQLAEVIGQALTQIGYGLSGLKSKTYGGKLEFNKTDWQDKYNNILQDYRTRLDTIKSESKAEAQPFEERDRQRGKLAEDKISQAERQYIYGNKEEAAKRKPAKSSSPRLESADKILKEMREVEGLQLKYNEAKSDKERAAILKDINTKLGEQSLAPEELKEVLDSSKPAGFWKKVGTAVGLSEESPNKFKDLIDTQREKRLSELDKRNKEKLKKEDKPAPTKTEEVPASGPALMKLPDGRTVMMPAESVEKALQLGAVLVK